MINIKLGLYKTEEKLSKSVTESIPGSSVQSSYKIQSGLIQIQYNLLTLPDIPDDLLLKTKTWS